MLEETGAVVELYSKGMPVLGILLDLGMAHFGESSGMNPWALDIGLVVFLMILVPDPTTVLWTSLG